MFTNSISKHVFAAKTMFITFLLSLGLLGGCSSEDTAVQHFQDMGFSNVRVIDSSYIHLCGKGYDTQYTITGTNPAGRQVRMNACCGFMRGCVTRTF